MSYTGMIVGICIGLTIFIIVAIFTYFKRKRQPKGTVFSAPVVVTSTTTTAGGYPVSVEPTPGGGYQATPYPTGIPMPMPTSGTGAQPYPTHPGVMPMPTAQPMPYPPPGAGFVPNVTPYPPAGPVDSHANPPSYDQVVAADTYGKQAPYNPNYTASH